jgi:intein/homing endonuclease
MKKKTFSDLKEGDFAYIVRKNGFTITEVTDINTLDTGEIRFYLKDGFIGGYLYNPKNNHLISVDTIILNKEDIIKEQLRLTKKHLTEINRKLKYYQKKYNKWNDYRICLETQLNENV